MKVFIVEIFEVVRLNESGVGFSGILASESVSSIGERDTVIADRSRKVFLPGTRNATNGCTICDLPLADCTAL
jgi:hypothetical protein